MRLIVFISLVLISGCSIEKRCAKLFPADTIVQIERVTNTEYRDTLIFKYLEGDTVFEWSDTVIIDNKVNYRPVFAETNLASAMAWVEVDRLNLELIQKDSILEIMLDSAVKTRIDTIFINKDITRNVEVEKPISKYPVFWVLILLLALALVGIIKR